MYLTPRRFLQQSSNSIFHRAKNLVKNTLKPARKQEFNGHIVQIGDPVLRQPTQEVSLKAIDSSYVKGTVYVLKQVIDDYAAVGLSAPQIGVSLKIVCVQFTEEQLSKWDKKLIKEQEMEVIPKTILINPTLKVTNEALLNHREGCCSMHGFSAVVPRHKSVQVNYHNEEGQKATWNATGWTARILQHELDHLHGKLFVDRMKNESLMFNYWQAVNEKHGDFYIGFGGFKSVGQLKFVKLR